MVGRNRVPGRLQRRSSLAAVGPLLVVGAVDPVGLMGWVAGAFMVFAVAATVYLAFVGARDDGHGPVGVGDAAGDDRPTRGKTERESVGDE